ncbi:MAG TPA: PLP-dependent aspartate aminotransferase family protein [Oligoflexus sp.]|uniref:trans-sulfuration enzyme family protein n=1 Tax=Oligoflexus sp. TaxID=1971216 RepID=UPI002D44E441|nr:PLP-dependent aspartate aminotransferase family protein [Oligoflexus sp.]HYX31683.1 PLP-dependent aspartate aminotransferase family protein [Oligoflexus sp.]
MHLSTRSIHIGNEKDPLTGAVIPPLYLSSTFAPPGEFSEALYDYSRSGNPTRGGLETTIAALEEGVGALAYGSGMAAIHGALMLLKSGDHVVAGTDIYGGTYRILHKILNRVGIETTLVPLDDLEQVAAAIRPTTRMIWAENPGNPLLSLVDLATLADIAHQHGALLAVDNTFATPVATQPLKLGADIVMHSATKYLGGHSDLLGGALVVRDKALLKELYFIQNATGGVMAPLDCYLCARGIKTLEVRFREQCKSALWIAQFLENHPSVKKVYYPGLPSHPQHELAQKQLRGLYGGVVSFELKSDFQAAKRFVSSTQLFQRAVSMGAVESLIEQPASMSHASYDKADRLKAGIDDGLIRLSIGLEHVQDLIEDLQGAFQLTLEQDECAPSVNWNLEAGYFS